MDDLLGEDWQQPAKQPSKNAPSSANTFASSYSGFRASPQLQSSGAASPQNISRPSSTVNGATKAPANDSFGSLLNLKSQKPGSGLSMQERQKQLLEEKRKQQEQQSQLWDTLGSGRGTPEIRQPSPAVSAKQEDEDDILAAFNRDAPVNKASHFAPPPASGATSGRSTPARPPSTTPSNLDQGGFDDDDDTFGLRSMPSRTNGRVTSPLAVGSVNDDDILGDLGRPVTDLPPKKPEPVPAAQQQDNSSSDDSGPERPPAPQDRQLAELVDMGFPADTARIALAENGGNVQNAVGWLLQQAHEESRQKARGQSQQRPPRDADSRSPQRGQRNDRSDRDGMPAWMREESLSGSRQRNNASSANGEKDASQKAQEMGSRFLKSANTLWKAGQKQMAKTMADFQQPDGESSQPKWMREPETARSDGQNGEVRKPRTRPQDVGVTDEAAMLDAPRERPQKQSRSQPSQSQPQDLPSRTRSPLESTSQRPAQQPQQMQRPATQQDKRPTSRITRQEVEDQTAQAYVSPARRRKATPKPEPPPEPEVDLFSPAPSKPSPAPAASSAPTRTTSASSKPRPPPAQPRAEVPPRNIPSVSPSALSTSASHRKAGGEHFKRGDYAAAHESYTSALTLLPASHPIAIVVLSNRALTGLKTGDAKTAVSDADRALEIIGPGFGSNETIDLGGAEGSKDMKEFYGKALMRKAEALEHMEKYSEAAAAWRQAVSVGVGGAVSLRGRDRCEKAAAPKPAVSTASRPVPKPSTPAPGTRAPPAKSLGNSMQRPTLSSAGEADAVKKLRQANAAAEKADDEKFALTDQVDARLTAWRGGKTENLRALLQSMDAVLWESAGWKKVGMADLVMPNKVKIVYMKAIAKVHPDKIPQDATTEQRMISAAVFSTLNEAWDKFKKDNNL